MGSDDDTHVTDPELTVQEPDSALGATAKSSHGSRVAQVSGPSSGRHQEHVQNLKEQSDNLMDETMRPDDNLINETEAPVEEPDTPSVASMRSGGADGSVRAFCPWSRTEEEHVRNLKENCRRAFFGNGSEYSRREWAHVQDDPWFARVVRELRADPGCSVLVIEGAPFPLPGVRPLHLAVLMGDLEMVQKILAEIRSGPLNQVHIDSRIGGQRLDYSALDLAIVVGESEIVDALLEMNAKVNTGNYKGSLQFAVRNLKENCRRAFFGGVYEHSRREWARVEDDPWFERVVRKLKADPGCPVLVIMVAPFRLENARPLHWAVLMGDLEMVQKILAETLSGPFNHVHIDSRIWGKGKSYSALDLAIVVGESEIVDALLEKNAKVNTAWRGSLQLAVLYAREERTSKIIQSLVRKGIDKNGKGIDINGKDVHGFTAFYMAVTKGKTNIVDELLRWKDKIKLNEACRGDRPPIQIANQEGFKAIESALMQCEDVRRFIEEAFRNRQAYVDAANAILVGAALIASVTFASWLQPPLSYTTSYHGSSLQYVDVEHNIALGSFWVFNTLSFYFAIGTVVFGAHSVLPRRQLFITENVKKLSRNLLLTSVLLAFSVLFVIVAFGIAGFIVLIPILRYRWYMIAPTILGGLVCVGSIGYLFKSLWENRPWNIRNRKRNKSESKRIDVVYD